MIGYIEGSVIAVYDQDLIVLAGGVGYEIYLGSAVLQSMNIKSGNNIKLYADTVVREDSIRIYGFETDTAKTFFRLLLSVSGIGPKLAMTVIGHVGVSRIIQSVKTGNYQVFEDVPGIGKKSAQKIVIELEAKLRKLSVPIDLSSGEVQQAESPTDPQTDLISALVNLGYTQNSVEKTVKSIWTDKSNFETMFRIAVKKLSEL